MTQEELDRIRLNEGRNVEPDKSFDRTVIGTLLAMISVLFMIGLYHFVHGNKEKPEFNGMTVDGKKWQR